MEPADEVPYPEPLGFKLSGHFPVAQGLCPHLLRLPSKGPDGVPALDFGAVVPVLARVLLHDALEFLHPVPVLVQLVLHGLQEPFLHQALLVPAVREQIRQAGFLQVDLFDDGLPFLIVDPVFRQLVEILPGLGRVVHVIIEERDAPLPLIGVEKLPAGGEALQGHVLFGLLHHREMVDVLLTPRFVFRYEINDFQFILAFLGYLLALPHHHAGEHIPGPLVQLPLHQDEGGLVGGEVAGKGTVLGILVAPVHKGGHHHLHQHGLPASVPQGKQSALAVEPEGLVADADGIVVIVQVDQAYCVDFAHIYTSPPMQSAHTPEHSSVFKDNQCTLPPSRILRTRWKWFWFSRFQSMN